MSAQARRFETPARVTIEHSDENLYAHVELDVEIGPGDRVRLQGPPIRVGFGEQAQLMRTAIVERASPLARLWARFAGNFALTELYEVSFSPRKMS